MPRFICDNCGKKVTKTGSRSASFKLHFCDNKCRFAYLRMYGPAHQNNIYTKTYTYKCIACLKIHKDGKSMNRKLCTKCQSFYNAYRVHKVHHPNITLSEFCEYILTLPKSIHKPQSRVILRAQNRKDYKERSNTPI